MNASLQTLDLDSWEAVWAPNEGGDLHGESLVDDKVIMVYDVNEKTAWATFTHEVLEIRIRAAIRPYRLLCNSLIDVIDKLAYSEKEKFLNGIPRTLEIVRAEAPGRS